MASLNLTPTQQTCATEQITLITHLCDDATPFVTHVQLSIHDTIDEFFTKCAAAWPHAFRSATDIKTVCYMEGADLVEIVRG